MKTIVTLSSAIALSLMVGTTVAVPDEGNWVNELLKEFDVDQDGLIMQTEAQRVLDNKFTTTDIDGDGFLTLDEIYREKHECATEHFAEMDSDKDGLVSDTEFRTQLLQIFERLDHNQDGVISWLEMDHKPPFFGHCSGKL